MKDYPTRRRVLQAVGGTVGGIALTGTGAARSEETGRLKFGDPVRLNPPGKYGYEPSVDVDKHGTIYATAHKSSITNEGTRLSSWFWYSIDGGETWHDMPSNGQVDNAQYAFEGDIAVDDTGHVYYCDTYLVDNHLNRWNTTPDGPVWDYSKPVHQTTGVDDRPWLQAHGDGVVYYIGNNGVAPPAPENPGDGGARYWFYRSTDGGLTWTPGHGFDASGWASLAASKADDKTVYVAYGTDKKNDEGEEPPFQRAFPGFPQEKLVVETSTDRGETWEKETVGTFENQAAEPFPVWSVTDRAGNPYHAWIDDNPENDDVGRIMLTRGGAGGWESVEITPHDGAFTKPWIAAGSEGFVAVTFYGTKPGVIKAGNDAEWYPYTLVAGDALADDPEWSRARLSDAPVATDGTEPEDFFECAIGPNDRIHVTFGREVDPGTFRNPTRTYRNNLLYVQGKLEGATGATGDRGENREHVSERESETERKPESGRVETGESVSDVTGL